MREMGRNWSDLMEEKRMHEIDDKKKGDMRYDK